jgi:hypothetical protein
MALTGPRWETGEPLLFVERSGWGWSKTFGKTVRQILIQATAANVPAMGGLAPIGDSGGDGRSSSPTAWRTAAATWGTRGGQQQQHGAAAAQ